MKLLIITLISIIFIGCDGPKRGKNACESFINQRAWLLGDKISPDTKSIDSLIIRYCDCSDFKK